MVMRAIPGLVNGRSELLDEVRYGLDYGTSNRILRVALVLLDQFTLEVLRTFDGAIEFTDDKKCFPDIFCDSFLTGLNYGVFPQSFSLGCYCRHQGVTDWIAGLALTV
jgi:hypothetical protein